MQLRPSSSSIWTKCDAQPRLAALAPPEVPSDPAREGTCAAWVAEMCLTGQALKAEELVGQTHENGWIVTDDMANHIQKYVDKIVSIGGSVHVERKVRLNQHIEGTPDAYAIVDQAATLHGVDLKYGFEIVEPYRNTQVAIYLGAILRGLTARGVVIRKVILAIYQPRAWHVHGVYREWVLLPEELMAFVQEIEAAGERAQNPNALATPGAHCQYCPAAALCHANAHTLYRMHEAMSVETTRHMTDEEMAEELKFLTKMDDMLSGRIRAVQTEAEARLKRGGHIPGWYLAERRGNRRLKYPVDVVEALLQREISVKKPMTVAEIERQGVPVDIVKAISEFPAIEPKLAPLPPNHYNRMFGPAPTHTRPVTPQRTRKA